jgi:hypothetical protein
MSELSARLPEARRYEACDDARGNPFSFPAVADISTLHSSLLRSLHTQKIGASIFIVMLSILYRLFVARPAEQ